jgi:hypothetical protein
MLVDRSGPCDARPVGGVAYRYRIGLRHGWRSRVLLGMACGLVAGLALAAVADARRTWSALPRALRDGAAADAAVAADATQLGTHGATAYADAVDRLPGVAASARTFGVDLGQVGADGQLNPQLRNGTALGLMLDEAAFTTVSRFRVLDGRPPALDRPDEVLINPELRAITGWHVGDRITDLTLFRLSDYNADFEPDPERGTPVALTVVGEARRADEYASDAEARVPRVYLTPAFGRANPVPWYYLNELVALDGGPGAVPAFRDAVSQLAATRPGGEASVSSIAEGEAFARSALRPQVVGLWLFAAVVLAGLVLVAGQAIGRQLSTQQRDLVGLRALGASRRDRWQLGVLHGATVAVIAAVVAVIVVVVTSLVTPLGAAHDIEPDTGLSIDVTVVAVGGLAVFALLTAVALLPAWRLARQAETPATAAAQPGGADRTSRVVATLARAGARPPVVVGARLALQPGRGPTAVPVRGVMVSIALATALLTATIGFHASLDRLAHTPRLYGWDWDAAVGADFGSVPRAAVDQLAALPDVESASAVTFGSVRVAGAIVPAVGVDLVRGTVFPTLDRGRLPQSPSEIVLGAKTLELTGAGLGDTIEVGAGNGARNMTIVGTATFPAMGTSRFAETSLGSGAATVASVLGQDDPAVMYNYVLLRFAPGVDRAEAVENLRALVLANGCNDQTCVVTDSRPAQLSAYTDLGTVWLLGAGALALLLAVTLVHGLVTSVRSRRRDLAIAKVLGFVRGQTSRTVMWEATTLALGGVVVGVPIGIVGANAAWLAFTDALGIHPNGSVPVASYILIVAFVMVGAAGIGLLCAIGARRMPIARVLVLQ